MPWAFQSSATWFFRHSWLAATTLNSPLDGTTQVWITPCAGGPLWALDDVARPTTIATPITAPSPIAQRLLVTRARVTSCPPGSVAAPAERRQGHGKWLQPRALEGQTG